MSTVYIASKHPTDLELQVGKKVIVINGAKVTGIVGADGEYLNDHGVTEDVPKDFWDAWVAQNKNHDLVRNGFIFAQEKRAEIKAETKEKRGNKTGSEQYKPTNKDGVETADK